MKKKVMIVDDNEDILKLVSKVIEINDMEAIPVSSGMECLRMLDAGRIPDAILLDVMMPEKDGYAVCREIKASDKYKRIVVIILTAKTQNRDQVDSYKSGADAYIAKPFNNDALVEDLKMYMDLKDRAGY